MNSNANRIGFLKEGGDIGNFIEDIIDKIKDMEYQERRILSLYLDIRPESLRSGKPKIAVKRFIKEKENQIKDKEEKRYFQKACEKVLNYVEYSLTKPGQGLAIFTDAKSNFWLTINLPVNITERLDWEKFPFIKPILLLLDEYERFGIVLVSRNKGRFFLSHLGIIQEYDCAIESESLPPTAGSGWSEADYKRKSEHLALRHYKSVIQTMRKLAEQDKWHRIIIGGLEENTSKLIELMPNNFKKILVDTFNIDIDAHITEIKEKVLAIEKAFEEKTEIQRVNDLLTTAKKGKFAVLGYPDTFSALNQMRVQLYVVPDDLKQEGWYCPKCKGLMAKDLYHHEIKTCLFCNNPDILFVSDIIEMSTHIALDQKAQIEIVRSNIKKKLTEEGPIGAFLRY